MHKCLSGTGSSIQISSFSETVGNWCSSSSSSALFGWQAIGHSVSEDCSILPWSVLLSLEESSLSSNVKQQHTVLRLPGCLGEYARGVVGLKDKFSLAEM